jgi:DNA polymerase-4
VDRCVAHIDLDAFYVSVELLRRPELKGLPVVVSGSSPRAVVTTASYEARKFGVHSAIPAARARRLCPDAIFIPPDFVAYREMSQRVMALVRAAAPTVEVAGLDEAYLELTGMLSPRAEMRRLVSAIRDQTGLGASVGIGPNKLVAKVCSDADKPAGFLQLTSAEARTRFGAEPPGLVPGIGPKTQEALSALGIRSLAALAQTPEATLVERFGARLGPYLRRRARFEDDGAVSSDRVRVSESRERTFPEDVRDPAELERILTRLAHMLAEDLEQSERRGRTVGIKVRLDDFSTHTRARTLPGPINDSATIAAVALELLRAFAPQRPVRLLGVRIAGFEERASKQAPAADGAGKPQLALPV